MLPSAVALVVLLLGGESLHRQRPAPDLELWGRRARGERDATGASFQA